MAVLIGDYNFSTMTIDMWILNLDKAQKLTDADDPSTIWTKIPGKVRGVKITHRLGAAPITVLEPESRSMWVMGGLSIPPYSDTDLMETSEVLVLPLNPSLKDIAVASVARNTCTKDPRLAPDQLASDLRSEVETYRSQIGGKYLCGGEEEGCSRCVPVLETAHAEWNLGAVAGALHGLYKIWRWLWSQE